MMTNLSANNRYMKKIKVQDQTIKELRKENAVLKVSISKKIKDLEKSEKKFDDLTKEYKALRDYVAGTPLNKLLDRPRKP
ncbi:MAG: hypothetical protein ABSE00_03760 [Chitinispirillaceae bacterium]|jgi:uncharacterized protein YjcR